MIIHGPDTRIALRTSDGSVIRHAIVPSHLESDVRSLLGFKERCKWYALLIKAYPYSTLIIQTTNGRFLVEPEPSKRH